jgi:hypothetical protein
MPAVNSSAASLKFRTLFLSFASLLAFILGLLFYRSFLPENVAFSNDGPLGGLVEAQNQVLGLLTGGWFDLNSIGSNVGTLPPSISSLLVFAIGPIAFAKFYPPAALFILGLGAWFFFRQLKLSPLAATLGALAAMLNSTFFSDACWGVASHEIAAGLCFSALGLVAANTQETRSPLLWTRLALAGLCVGMNVIEAADIGALYSLFVAAFVFYKMLVVEEGTVVKKMAMGVSSVAIVAVFAGFIALQTVLGLVGTQIQGIAGTGQDAETKAAHWDFATQWSLPKIETINLLVPGVFGYKMDTPQDMMPALQDAYRGGVYWGGVGREPAIDRFFDSGATGSPPPGIMRFSGGGNYCGILVALIAAWTVIQSWRRENSPFTNPQKKFIWFWTVVLFGSMLLAWGRFAPFYALPYQLPYFSTIRNPAKFLFFLSWATVILFAYGVHALSSRRAAKISAFDQKWIFATAGLFGASVLGWFFYASEKPALVRYLQARGFPDEDFARQIASFSIGQAGWWLFFFAGALILLTLVLRGYFAGPRAKWAGIFLGVFLVVDLGRANLPYVIHWDYKQKYEAGTLNPIETFLQDKPYEHRVAKLLPAPLSTPSQFQLFDELYGIEWTQHHFPFYNIQTLDVVQMPRMPENLQAYMNALRIGIKQDASGQYMLDEATFPKLTRLWELSNTRYLLGPAAFLETFNSQFDPGKNRLRIVQRFDVVPKPGIAQPTKLEELTAAANDNGQYALFEFTGALPRAKLYSTWQVNTNDTAVLSTLADQNFDPQKTVLVDTPQKDLPASSAGENSGTVEFKSYAPKKIIFSANAPAPNILLLNDKYDPAWRVTVDGKPAELLRCNYIMRGVYLPAGQHTVEFQFTLPHGPLYITIAAIFTGMILIGLIVFLQRKTTA